MTNTQSQPQRRPHRVPSHRLSQNKYFVGAAIWLAFLPISGPGGCSRIISPWGLCAGYRNLGLRNPSPFLVILSSCQSRRLALELPTVACPMVVTKAPSEPFAIVAVTLKAMLLRSFRTASADEDPSPEH